VCRQRGKAKGTKLGGGTISRTTYVSGSAYLHVCVRGAKAARGEVPAAGGCIAHVRAAAGTISRIAPARLECVQRTGEGGMDRSEYLLVQSRFEKMRQRRNAGRSNNPN